MTRPASFDASLVALRTKLRANALKLTRSPDKADDLVQETILKALRYYESYTQDTNFLGWLFTIMRNEHLTRIKKDAPLVDDPEGLAASLLSIKADQEDRFELKQVVGAIDRLTPDHREAMIGCMDEMPYADIARDCGVNEGTIKSRVNRARAHLKEMVA